MKKVKVILERGEDALWGRVEAGDFHPVTCGESLPAVEENLRLLIADYTEHEGKEDKKWKNVTSEQVQFEYIYDLTAFFDEFKFLNISAIAGSAGINESLMRQYAKGIKYPSEERVKMIESAIHKLAGKLQKIALTVVKPERIKEAA